MKHNDVDVRRGKKADKTMGEYEKLMPPMA